MDFPKPLQVSTSTQREKFIMSEAFSDALTDVNFFRNFNRVVGIAFLAIAVLTLGFFVYQINEKHKEELAVIKGHVARHSQFIEFVLRSSLDYLEVLRLQAESHYRSLPASTPTAKAPTLVPHPLRALLRQRKDSGSFDLDELPDRDAGGNLTGLGNLQGRSADFYQDLNMALDLNPTFF
jgi:sigma-B regulation protein RsbU (phosphoserine phosphatase)